ncbi:MAG: YbgA family protein [Myxococcota bacterium]
MSTSEARIRLGVSSCLLGVEVRYDGGHQRSRILADELGSYVEWVPVCPEVEAGLETPRPAMRLVREGDDIRMREIRSGRDHTLTIERFAARRVRALRGLDLSGYILKKGSPSCGMTGVTIHTRRGTPRREGRGLYAGALQDAYPDMPVEDEWRLNDAAMRENFIARVFAYRRLRGLFSRRWKNRDVVAFHAAHELQLMAHSPAVCRALGHRVAALMELPRAAFRDHYQREFMAALAKAASRGGNADVLQHAAGYLREHLAPASRAELTDLIRAYRRGHVPLAVPVTVIRHLVRHHEIGYLDGQVFLDPHPNELLLRNPA